MCGIAGFTHSRQRPAPDIIRRATESIRHRGPNQQGIYESADISLGAVRLKIIDLHGGDQPMKLESANLVVAYNGEIYNYLELRAELEKLGHEFQTHCDTEVVLHAFAQWDLGCLERLRGMFALAIWDWRERRLVLARDRLGIKPLYYAQRGSELHFGSELKALFAHPAIPRRLNRTGLAHYLALNYVPTPYTLAEGIQKLAPGGWLEFRQGRIRTGRYWTNKFAPENREIGDAVSELDDLLRSSVREHLISDVPLGIWASGGLDSSAILHYASEVATQKLTTFSISFTGRSFDESKFFRALASHYGTNHHEFDLNSDVDLTSAIHELAYYSDEPSADAGALPVYFLSRMTAQHVTVALSGEGADEVFGGYQTYLADVYAQRARALPAPLLKGALRLAGILPVSDDKISFEYKLKRFLNGALLPGDEAHFYWNGTFSRNEIADWGYGSESLTDRLDGVPHERDPIARYLFVDQHYYLPDDILYKCDRMSMAHSIEVRPPFLDHRIVEFAAQLPSHLKIRGKKTKFIMRELLKDKLPDLILQHRKEGLDIPAHEWLRGPLRPLVEDTLSADNVERAGAVPVSAVQSVIGRHMRREANLGYHLWGLLTLHLWMKRWDISVDAEMAAGEDRDLTDVLSSSALPQ